MSYFDNSIDSSWKHQASTETDNARYDDALENARYMRSSTAPSPYGFNSTATANYDNAENNVATATSNNYGNAANNNNFRCIDNGNSNPYNFDNSQQQQVAVGNHDVNDSNNIIAAAAAIADPIEEESQVVPISLDHLSRDELCRMIYRLDYERNALRDKLEVLEVVQSQLKDTKIMMVGRKSRKKRFRDTASSGNDKFSNSNSSTQQQNPRSAIAPSPPPPSPPPPTLEMEQLQKRIGANVHAAIKSKALHGGRKVPKSTITMNDTPLSLVTAIMSPHRDKLSSESKRMIKWNLVDDKDIASVLMSERLIHPVKHDGTDHILPSGSSRSNMYYWAKFVGMEMKYDKREMALVVIAKTMAAGSGRPENVPERVRYSRGDDAEGSSEDFAPVDEEGESNLFG